MKNILVIAPHPDDEVLGAGGVICRHVAAGDKVAVAFVCDRAYNHAYVKKYIQQERAAAMKAKAILGYHSIFFLGLKDELLDVKLQDVIIAIEEITTKVLPDIAYLPHRGDNNQDHRAVFQAAMVALRSFAQPKVSGIYSYETASSTEQAGPFPECAFLPNYFVDISGYIGRKLKALSCYDREKRQYPHPRSREAVEIFAKARGACAGLKSAEAFEAIRIIKR